MGTAPDHSSPIMTPLRESIVVVPTTERTIDQEPLKELHFLEPATLAEL